MVNYISSKQKQQKQQQSSQVVNDSPSQIKGVSETSDKIVVYVFIRKIMILFHKPNTTLIEDRSLRKTIVLKPHSRYF